MTSYYAKMLLALVANRVKFVVAGGVACVRHGVERVTMDLNLAVEMTDEDLQRFVEAAESLNLKPRVPVPITFLLKQSNRQQMVEEKNAFFFGRRSPDSNEAHRPLPHR